MMLQTSPQFLRDRFWQFGRISEIQIGKPTTPILQRTIKTHFMPNLFGQ